MGLVTTQSAPARRAQPGGRYGRHRAPRGDGGLPAWAKDVGRLVRLDLQQFFGNKLVAVSTLLTSVSMVLAFGAATRKIPSPTADGTSFFDFVFPGIVGVGIMFSCAYTIGFGFIVDRNRRTMEDLILSPLSYAGFLVGRLIGVMAKCSFQFVLVLVLGRAFFGTRISSYPILAYGFVAECLVFAALGIYVATFTNEVSFPAVINILLIPLTYFAGVFFPIGNLGLSGKIFADLPLAVHINVFRDAISPGRPSADIRMSLWLAAAQGVGMMLAAAYSFRWRIRHG